MQDEGQRLLFAYVRAPNFKLGAKLRSAPRLGALIQTIDFSYCAQEASAVLARADLLPHLQHVENLCLPRQKIPVALTSRAVVRSLSVVASTCSAYPSDLVYLGALQSLNLSLLDSDFERLNVILEDVSPRLERLTLSGCGAGGWPAVSPSCGASSASASPTSTSSAGRGRFSPAPLPASRSSRSSS